MTRGSRKISAHACQSHKRFRTSTEGYFVLHFTLQLLLGISPLERWDDASIDKLLKPHRSPGVFQVYPWPAEKRSTMPPKRCVISRRSANHLHRKILPWIRLTSELLTEKYMWSHHVMPMRRWWLHSLPIRRGFEFQMIGMKTTIENDFRLINFYARWSSRAIVRGTGYRSRSSGFKFACSQMQQSVCSQEMNVYSIPF